MKDLLDKLSSYSIFNYLFPGIAFAYIASRFTSYNFLQKDMLVGAFLYYFIGLIISRIGSIFIEPFFKFIKFIKFSDYSKFVKASKADIKIETLSEVNNMYRTICSMFIILILLRVYEKVSAKWAFFSEYEIEIMVVSLMILFLFSYRKQTNYITKRIDANE